MFEKCYDCLEGTTVYPVLPRPTFAPVDMGEFDAKQKRGIAIGLGLMALGGLLMYGWKDTPKYMRVL